MRRIMALIFIAGIVGIAYVVLLARPMYAHGFGERYDLPLPLWLYVAGAASVVGFSFITIGLFVGEVSRAQYGRRINILRWRVGRVLVHPATTFSAKALSVLMFGLVIVAGLIGNSSPLENITPTAVWVIWWIGIAYVSALVGNVWDLINPWKIIFEWVEGVYFLLKPVRNASPRYEYPVWLGVWPGLVFFLVFAWTETVYEQSSVPGRIAQMIIFYSVVSWAGMFVYGKIQWLQHGDAFSIVFRILAKFAPTEIRVLSVDTCAKCPIECLDGVEQCVGCVWCFREAPRPSRELNVRPFAVGLLRNHEVTPSMLAFVIVLLSVVTFDGFTSTPLWSHTLAKLYDRVPNLVVIRTFGLIAFPIIFIAVYFLFSLFMAKSSGNRLPTEELARAFVYSLVPIALAYHLAHYLSFLLVQGQLIIPLVSDPLGFGWNIFGTADYLINISVVSARGTWFMAVGFIVVGHIIAVYLAHIMSLRTLTRRHLAIRSQYPMIVLMVGYTVISMWILAQPITSE